MNLPGRPATEPTLIFRPASFFERLELGRLFSSAQPLEVELGAGDGSFLARYAALRPDRNFIGVERLLGRLRKLDKKGRRAHLANLRLLRVEAGYFVEYMLPPESAGAIHIYFPDPWPKRKHRRKRLVNEHFAETARRALELGGSVFFRTDDLDYFGQMRSVFGTNPNFSSRETPPELAELATDFERDFQARGIATYRAAYQRVG